MTITPEALEALSKAATQGLLKPTAGTGAHIRPDEPAVFVACMGRPQEEREASTAFLIELWNLYRTGHLVLVDDGAVERVAVPKRLTPEMEEAGIAASEDHFVMDNITVTGLHKFYEAAIAALQVKP